MSNYIDLSGSVLLSNFLPAYLRALFLDSTPVPPGGIPQVSCLGSEPGPFLDYEVPTDPGNPGLRSFSEVANSPRSAPRSPPSHPSPPSPQPLSPLRGGERQRAAVVDAGTQTLSAEGQQTDASTQTPSVEGHQTDAGTQTLSAEGQQTNSSTQTLSVEGQQTDASTQTPSAQDRQTDASTQTLSSENRRTATTAIIIRRNRLLRGKVLRVRRGFQVFSRERQSLQERLDQEQLRRRELELQVQQVAEQQHQYFQEQLAKERQLFEEQLSRQREHFQVLLAQQQGPSAAQLESRERSQEESQQMEMDAEESIGMHEEEGMETASPQSSPGMDMDGGEGIADLDAEDPMAPRHPSPVSENAPTDSIEDPDSTDNEDPMAPWHPSFVSENAPTDSIEDPDATDYEEEYRPRQLAEGPRQASPDARRHRTDSDDDSEPTSGALQYQPEEAPHGSWWQDEPAYEEPRSSGDSTHHYDPERSVRDAEASGREDWEEMEEEGEEEEPRGRGRESAPSPEGRDSAEGENPGHSAGDPVVNADELFASLALLSLRGPT